MDFTKDINFNVNNLIKDQGFTLTYNGPLAQNSKDVYIHFGFDSAWKNSCHMKMEKAENGLSTSAVDIEIKEYNKTARTWISTVKYPNNTIEKTNSQTNSVKFVYEGNSGEKIRLAGSFTNWDSFIYYLKETKVGYYEIEIPLPPGTYYYTFYNGLESSTLVVNGKSKVKSAPIENDDVVRLGDISKLLALINGLTDTQIASLNSFAKNLTEEV